MFKKAVIFSLAVVWVLVGVSTMALAAQNVGNTSQKGSLLIFPKIDTTTGRDTLIRISNDYPNGTFVKCYWVNQDQDIQDFQFLLTITQPVWFRASDGLGTASYNPEDASTNPISVPPFFSNSVGELKCWAVNFAGTEQISWNHLSGNAMVLDYVAQTAYEYNSYNFTVRDLARNANVGTAGIIKLSGATTEYDACPQYLTFNFFTYDPTAGSTRAVDIDGAAQVQFNKTDLTLVPCKQDLRQDRTPTCSKAKFDIWNENETKYTGAYQCFKCWFEGYLNDIDTAQGQTIGFGGEKFTYPGLHTTMGRFRVTGIPSTVCKFGVATGPFPTCPSGAGVATPLLGITSTQVQFLTPSTKSELVGAVGVGAGTYTADPVYIRWDKGDAPEETPGK